MKATCRPVADRDTLSERLGSFDALLNASPWLAVLDPDGRVKEISRAALATLGLQRDEVVGRLFVQLPRLTEVSRAVDDALAGRTGLQEIQISNPGGGPARPVELCLDPLFDPAGHVSAVVVEGRDVSRFQVAGVGYWSLRPAGQRLWLNPWWAPPLGFTPAELAPEDLASFLSGVHPDDHARAKQELERILDGADLGRFEFRWCLPDGRVRWLATYAALRTGEGGTRARIDGITFDITDRKLAYNRLDQELAERTRAEAEIVALSRRLLEAQEEERTRIARELHDDLSQQVAALGIALNVIRHQIPTERREVREQAERLYQRVTQIGASIRHLSHQLHPAVLEHAGLAPALEAYRAEFEQLAGVKTEIQTDGRFDDVPGNVSLAVFRITQEALQNVWKHSGAKKAAIRLARRDGQVLLQVSDEGIGFDAAEPQRSGLGLISMRERAKLLGGTLSIESALGLGTTLTITLPLSSAKQQQG
jgi:two-component system sensor histidine kinase UhpB